MSAPAPHLPESVRVHVRIEGAVQGIGFRPFIHNRARQLGLVGWVRNAPHGAEIEVEGTSEVVGAFLSELSHPDLPHCRVESVEPTLVPCRRETTFKIEESDARGLKSVTVLPDLAVCGDCKREIFDPSNRRYGYPFTNCTRCGPRFSIVESLPYDRKNTTMNQFVMCPACLAEYENPFDRRFHAQPNACPDCGPRVELWDADGHILAKDSDALQKAAQAILAGSVVAVKGIGGFQLLVDARNDQAVTTLRQRKNRARKPFAIMVASSVIARSYADFSDEEKTLLESPAAPIVLLRKTKAASDEEFAEGPLSNLVAPDSGFMGVMLPYSPLHILLMDQIDAPLVATSGNASEEPICIDNVQALDRLGRIADLFLVHNRGICRPMDDSVVRWAAGRPLIIRAARGYAPITLRREQPTAPLLAVGGHMKNTVGISNRKSFVLSPHIGDLDAQLGREAFLESIMTLKNLYGQASDVVAADSHPEYASTQMAETFSKKPILVQHHHAHVAAVMAEHDLSGPVLGVAWDGTGFGSDGTIWGGEFLVCQRAEFKRVGRLRPFLLPGADQAAREPRRSALGLLYEMFGESAFDFAWTREHFLASECATLRSMFKAGASCRPTSSIGRLFDGVAALVGVLPFYQYEGAAPLKLESLIEPGTVEIGYPLPIRETHDGLPELDWLPVIAAVLDDTAHHESEAKISARFHLALVEGLVAVVERFPTLPVVLAGGCFQNAFLIEHAVRRLRQLRREVFWPHHFPCNDGALALGQLFVATEKSKSETSHVLGNPR